jgi:signal transduction histidine kinase
VKRLVHALRRRQRFNVLAFTLTVLVAVAALEAADLAWRRERALLTAERRASNLCTVLAEYVRGTYTAADAALRQLQVHGNRVGGPSATKEDWASILGPARAGLPEIGSISVTDKNGIILHSTLPSLIGQSRADSYVFRRLSTSGKDEGVVVDRPYTSRSAPPQYIVPVGRRLTNDGGGFDGIVVATLLPEQYREFIKSISVGREGVITVLHPDGVVLFREPSTENPINEAAADHPLFALARERADGVVRGQIPADGPRYVTAYRVVQGNDLIVAVSLTESEVLADWWLQARVAGAAFGALTATVGLVIYAFFRVVGARERAERELAAVQRLEADRLRFANEQLAAALEGEQRARKEVEAASYMKDEFLMTVSHELRTPLTAIYGWARVLGTKQMKAEDQARAVAAIERNAYAQTRLIDDLLDVSRAISGKLRLEVRPVNVEDVVRTAIETVRPAITGKGLTLEAAYDPGLPLIKADPDRLQQIVWNLISNATKFTPEGGSIRVRATQVDSTIELTVSDTGAGIAPEFLPHAFERFRQADTGTRRRYGGLGLGLAIVRHLVELHGGTVSAESEGEGHGATFRVRLPVA